MTDTNNTAEQIKINDLFNNITDIVKSNDKNEFITKYNEYHTKIKQVDEILYKPNTIDNTLDINILFEMLKEYDNILETTDITIEEYKNIVNLVEIIETKIKSSVLEYKEV